MASRIITLVTDFGIQDAYVGVMKGVILGINPQVQIVDISHQIEPQNISQAASLIRSATPYFPQDTIHLVVVDPGVGGSRKPIIAKTEKAFFVGPDNGVFSYVFDKPTAAFEITNEIYFLKPVSNTFHGRDIFAPVSAHLSTGVPINEFGKPVDQWVKLAENGPKLKPHGTVAGKVVYVDRYGNLITNIPQENITTDAVVQIKGFTIRGISTSYLEGGELLAIIGSEGNLEIARPNGSASKYLNCMAGDAVKVVSGNLKA